MILLLGAGGYIGQAFARELRNRSKGFVPLSRSAFDYTRFELLFQYVRQMRPDFVINAAGHAEGEDNDPGRREMFQANTVLPQTIERVCQVMRLPWGHVSSGSIYCGAKVCANGAGTMRAERNLNRPELKRLFAVHPERFCGFTELDEPNFTFRSPPCTFYSGTKAAGEEALRDAGMVYIWRAMEPFNEEARECNWLARLQRAARVHDHLNSLSHLGDFVRACVDLAEMQAPFGTYNIVNPGVVTTRQVVEMIRRIVKPYHKFRFWKDVGSAFDSPGDMPRPSCVLDGTRLRRAGVKLRRVEDALEESLGRWERRVQPGRKPELAVV